MDWRKFLTISAEHLSAPIHTVHGKWNSDGRAPSLRSWCSWTTFDRLGSDAGYWGAALPETWELNETYVADGGTWGQPFGYDLLAHLIIPHQFYEEYQSKDNLWTWKHTQDIDGLSKLLMKEGLEHRLSKWVIDVKLY